MATFEYKVWKKLSPNPRSNAWRHEILIDGQSVSSGYCIDMRSVVESFFTPGDYYILTCSCGEPGCAGLFEPFHVAHLGDGIIHWHFVHPEPEREAYFSSGQAVRSLLSGLLTSSAHGGGGPDAADLIQRLKQLQPSLNVVEPLSEESQMPS